MLKGLIITIAAIVACSTISIAQVGTETPKALTPQKSLRKQPDTKSKPDNNGAAVIDSPKPQNSTQVQQPVKNNAGLNNANQNSLNNNPTEEKEKKKFKINFKKLADGVDILIGVIVAGVAVFFMVVPTVEVLLNQYS